MTYALDSECDLTLTTVQIGVDTVFRGGSGLVPVRYGPPIFHDPDYSWWVTTYLFFIVLFHSETHQIMQV